MFKTRLLSGIVLIVLLLALGIAGGDVLLAALAVVSTVGMYELYRVFHLEKSILSLAGYAAVLVYYLGLKLSIRSAGTEVFLLSMVLLIILMSFYVFSYI